MGFAAKHGLKRISVADLIAHRQAREKIVERVNTFQVMGTSGPLTGYAYVTPYDPVIASIAAGSPCDTAVLEKSKIDSRAKLTAAENDASVWDETRCECDEAAREEETAVAVARERVARAAREIICNSGTVANLVDELTGLQSEVVNRRSVLRFIHGQGLNGEMERPLSEQVERVLRQDLLGLEPTSASRAWSDTFEELLTNADAKLPGD